MESIKNGTITKEVVSWCIGTCSDYFSTEVQFGHAGSSVNGVKETATAKNTALRSVGMYNFYTSHKNNCRAKWSRV